MVKRLLFKKRWLPVLVVLLLLTLGGGGEDLDSGGTSGVVVGPYIAGAFFEEVSAEGDILQISTESDAWGRFYFKNTVQDDSIIRMIENEAGYHVDKPHNGTLRGSTDDAGTLVVSPLTTLLANGFTAEQII